MPLLEQSVAVRWPCEERRPDPDFRSRVDLHTVLGGWESLQHMRLSVVRELQKSVVLSGIGVVQV